MPVAAIPAIIGVVGSIIGSVAGGGGGPKDTRTPDQKRVAGSLEGDFEQLDGFSQNFNPFNLGATPGDVQGQQQGKQLAGGGVDFLPQIPGVGQPPGRGGGNRNTLGGM